VKRISAGARAGKGGGVTSLGKKRINQRKSWRVAPPQERGFGGPVCYNELVVPRLSITTSSTRIGGMGRVKPQGATYRTKKKTQKGITGGRKEGEEGKFQSTRVTEFFVSPLSQGLKIEEDLRKKKVYQGES